MPGTFLRVSLRDCEGRELPNDDVTAWLEGRPWNGFACYEVGDENERPHLHVILDDVNPENVRTQWRRDHPDYRGNTWFSAKYIKDKGAHGYGAKGHEIVWKRGYTDEQIHAFGDEWNTAARAKARKAQEKAQKKQDFVEWAIEVCESANARDRRSIALEVTKLKRKRGGVVVVNYLRGVTNAVYLSLAHDRSKALEEIVDEIVKWY